MRATSKLGAITASVGAGLLSAAAGAGWVSAGFAGAGAGGAVTGCGGGAVGDTAAKAARSDIFTRQAIPTAAAITTAPIAISAITVRDMKLPMVRRPTAIGVAPHAAEMIP
jgi:hypothetical protein